MDKSWPACPKILINTCALLQKLHLKNIVRKYCLKYTRERKKTVSSILFESKIKLFV